MLIWVLLLNNANLDIIYELIKHLKISHNAPRDVVSLDNSIIDGLSRRLSERCILARTSLQSGSRLYNTWHSVDNNQNSVISQIHRNLTDDRQELISVEY